MPQTAQPARLYDLCAVSSRTLLCQLQADAVEQAAKEGLALEVAHGLGWSSAALHVG